MSQRDLVIWRLSLAAPANGILFSAWGDAIDVEAERLPADLLHQVASLQADSRAFWRQAVEDMAENPHQAPQAIIAQAGQAVIEEAAEALIVALSLARPDVLLDIDINLVP